MADVVLLHAFPVTSALWTAQAEALRGAGHRAWTPDLPGFGAAPLRDEKPSLDRMADAILALCDQEGLGQVVVGGLSMGGYVSMALLRQAPERVAALVLADTKGTADTDEGRAGRLAMAQRMDSGGVTAALAEGMIPALLGETTRRERPEVVETVSGWIGSALPRSVAWAQRAMAARRDSLATLAAFDGPALVVWGEEDVILSPRTEQDLLVDALPDVELAVIPAAGHLSAVENPDAVSGVLLDFIDAL